MHGRKDQLDFGYSWAWQNGHLVLGAALILALSGGTNKD